MLPPAGGECRQRRQPLCGPAHGWGPSRPGTKGRALSPLTCHLASVHRPPKEPEGPTDPECGSARTSACFWTGPLVPGRAGRGGGAWGQGCVATGCFSLLLGPVPHWSHGLWLRGHPEPPPVPRAAQGPQSPPPPDKSSEALQWTDARPEGGLFRKREGDAQDPEGRGAGPFGDSRRIAWWAMTPPPWTGTSQCPRQEATPGSRRSPPSPASQTGPERPPCASGSRPSRPRGRSREEGARAAQA